MNIAALIIAASLLASRVLGILREMLLARVAGVALEKNALDLAFMIPDILNHVVSTGFLSIVFIPIFTGYMVRGEEDRAWRFFSNILNVMGSVLLLLTVPSFIWMRELILLFTAADPSPELLEKATYYGRIILPGQIFFLAGSFMVAVQHTRKQFLLPSLTGVVYNVAIVVGGWIGRAHGVEGFAWGVPVGACIGFGLLQLIGIRRGKAQYFLIWKPRDPDFRKALALMLPMMLGVGSMFAMEFVIRSFGAAFGNHGISSLNYAYRLMYTLVAVFGFSVGVASYPDMARLAKQGMQDELGERIWRSMGRMFAILVPAVVWLAMIAFPAVRLLFERGAFSRSASEQVASLLLWYLPASVGLCGQAVLVRAFYAQERMWLPTLLNTAIFLLTLPAYTLLSHVLGIQSVPLVGALGALSQVLVMAFSWRKINGQAGMGAALSDVARAILVLAMGLLAAQGIAQAFYGWVRTASLPWLLAYVGLIGMLCFPLLLGLQRLMGSLAAKELLQGMIEKVRKKFTRKLARG